MKKLLRVGLAEFTLRPSSLFRRALSQRFSSQSDDGSGENLSKARSTAEEFIRQAKEKAESLKNAASEVAEDAKESVAGEKGAGEEKLKGKKEK